MPATKPRLAIGPSDFAKLRSPGTLYIDKSALIRKVLNDPTEVMLLPRPRRFGKTTNLSMLRYFFEKTAEDHSALFQDLSVWRDEDARAHFGRYPVIALTFKDIKGLTWPETLAGIKQELSRAYADHLYLLQDLSLMPAKAARFEDILARRGEVEIYQESLRALTGTLRHYHGAPVILLLDEYDTPLHAAYAHGYYPEAVSFFRGLLSGALKDNAALFKGVVTGILRIAKEGLFSGLNNLGVYTLLHPDFASDFGFTEPEVAYLVEQTQSPLSLEALRDWYNGYSFGGQVIYNPWSVLWALRNEQVGPYWRHTGSDEVIRELLLRFSADYEDGFSRLLQGEGLRQPVLDSVALGDVNQRSETLWSFLLYAGYLKATDVKLASDEGWEMTVRLPNREVAGVFQGVFREWLARSLGGAPQVEALLRALLCGDAGGVEVHLGRLLLESASFLDATERAVAMTPEQVYHAFVLGLLVHLQPRYLVRSNRESGHGRYDILLEPRESGQPGVVLEFKVRRGAETVGRLAGRALRQLARQDYAAELRARGVRVIYEYAVVFDGKRVQVALGGRARDGKVAAAPRRPRLKKPR